MKIAILGAGNVGRALGRRLGIHHDIFWGVRAPDDPRHRELEVQVEGSEALSVGEAARRADLVLLATPWDATEAAIREAGFLDGKILIDCTNPLGFGEHGFALTVGHDASGAEQVAAWAAGAKVIKTFNQTGYENLGNPAFDRPRAVMFVAGDDAEAKRTVLALADEVGFEPVDAGGLANARLLEPLALLWIRLAREQGLGADFAFAIVRRD